MSAKENHYALIFNGPTSNYSFDKSFIFSREKCMYYRSHVLNSGF